ncbi:ATP-binding protein [Undibacterium umbellatum]|uniref:histidine kinase n=1 Tax=Undibacterium umbellatum TaxID=2762300 RepID=A0ABR6ZDB8_9BURK|nr:ATP-binding protein [Undibacterium umbellatum]MBC3909581.1 PAS domain S-box protein [Undibacterium umbellatum]
MNFKTNITIRLIAYLLVVSVLPLLAYAIVSFDMVKRTVIDLADSYSAQLISNQRDYLLLQTAQIESLAARIASIEEIGLAIANTDASSSKERNSFDELSTQVGIRQSLNAYSNLKGLVSIDLFTAKGNRFYVGDTLAVPAVNDAQRQRIYEAAVKSSQSLIWLGVEDNLNTASPARKVLTAVKVIRRYSEEKRDSEAVGMLLINYSTEYLAENFSRLDLGREAYLLVTDAQGRLVYAPEPGNIGQAAPGEIEALRRSVPVGQASSTERQLGPHKALVNYSCTADGLWCVFGVIPKQTLLAPMNRIALLATIVMLMCFGVIALAGRHFKRKMVEPVKAISDGFRLLQENKFDISRPLPLPTGQDEITELVAWFNAFLETLQMRQRHEQELTQSEYKFSAIFQLSPMALALIRIENGEFVDVNNFWLMQFGFQREDVVGKRSRDFGLWVDLKQRENMVTTLQTANNLDRFEVQQRRKDGRILICELFGRPIEFQHEKLYIFCCVDITRQREAEQQILEINQQLESRVHSRTMVLEQTNRELAAAMNTLNRTKDELVRSEKLAALGSLVAGIAHELNTPIGNSVTVASTLQDESAILRATLESGKLRRSSIDNYLATITTGAELLMRNLGNAHELISSFKQVTVDQSSNQRRPFMLKETLEEIVATLVPMYKKSGHNMHCELVSGVMMDSYPGPLGQVITNFVTNALSHAFEGRSNGMMTLKARMLNPEQVEIIFSDNGTGISDEHHSRVFDPFFTTKLGKGGSGLGMSIAYNIVTSILGGAISLQSRVGEGSSFILILPLCAPVLQGEGAQESHDV